MERVVVVEEPKLFFSILFIWWCQNVWWSQNMFCEKK